jgi:hypothetical protein
MKKIFRVFTLMAMVTMMALGFGAVLSADASISRKESGLQSFPVAGSSTQIYKGAFVCLNTSGYLVAAADTEGLRFVGVAYENVLNAGSDGDKTCRVHTEGVFQKPATSITQAMVGRKMFVVDDATMDESSTNKVEIGTLVSYDSTTSGWVDIGRRDLLLGLQDHLAINTDLATKTVRLNNKTFTNTSGDITGARVAPRVGATTTGSVRGIECIPGGTSTFGYANLQGIISECYGNTSGNITGIVAAFEGKVDMPSGYAGTVTGPVSILRCFNDMHGTVTNGVYVLDVANHGGNKAWDGFIRGAEALGTHSMTTSSDKTGQAKSGTIKVKFNNTLYHIQLYAD